MTQTKTVRYGLSGLEYVYLAEVPIAVDGGCEYIDLPPGDIEKSVAKEIVRRSIPIRGQELVFLRKTLALSQDQLASRLGKSATIIREFENAREKRLPKIETAAIRLLCAEELRLKLEGKWSVISAIIDTPERLEVFVPAQAP